MTFQILRIMICAWNLEVDHVVSDQPVVLRMVNKAHRDGRDLKKEYKSREGPTHLSIVCPSCIGCSTLTSINFS